MDDETAKRIAQELYDRQLIGEGHVDWAAGSVPKLAKIIQQASEPRRVPGLYFIREDDGTLRLKSLLTFSSESYPVWQSERAAVQTDKPGGKIVAGPYDVQELWGCVTDNWGQSEIDEALKGASQ